MKEMWETPRVLVERFEANEYVAACWGVACDVDWANKYERWQGDHSNGITHDAAHCGNSSNQVIIDRDNDGVADEMIEIKTDGLGNLECVIYTDERYNQKRDISDVAIGNLIYWTTSSGNRTWNHRGYVTATVPGHPNRS